MSNSEYESSETELYSGSESDEPESESELDDAIQTTVAEYEARSTAMLRNGVLGTSILVLAVAVFAAIHLTMSAA